MALNPNIILQAGQGVPKLETPYERLMKRNQAAAQENQLKMQQMQMADMERQNRMAEEGRSILAEAKGNYRAAGELASSRGLYDHAERFSGIADKHDTEIALTQKALSEMNEKLRARTVEAITTGGKVAKSILDAPPEQREAIRARAAQQFGQWLPDLVNADEDGLRTMVYQASAFMPPDQAEKPLTNLGKLKWDLAKGNISQQQYDAMIRKETTHAPGVSVSYGTPMEVFDPRTGQPKLVMPTKDGSFGETPYLPKSVIETENKLRDEYNTLTKPMREVRDAYGRIQSTGTSATAAGDLSLIYGYMKILDPGSTVREGEFANAQNAGGIPDRVRAAYNKAISGERLAPNVRQDFLGQADKLYKQYEKDAQVVQKRYTEIATRSGARPENVVVDYGSTFKAQPPQAPQQPQAPGKWQPVQPTGEPDLKTLGKNTRHPNAVWMGKGAPQGGGWYVKDNGMIRRVE